MSYEFLKKKAAKPIKVSLLVGLNSLKLCCSCSYVV